MCPAIQEVLVLLTFRHVVARISPVMRMLTLASRRTLSVHPPLHLRPSCWYPGGSYSGERLQDLASKDDWGPMESHTDVLRRRRCWRTAARPRLIAAVRWLLAAGARRWGTLGALQRGHGKALDPMLRLHHCCIAFLDLGARPRQVPQPDAALRLEPIQEHLTG